MLAGIDEAGRGAWAGPLYVGAVILGEVNIPGLADSKKLSRGRRIGLFEQIMRRAYKVGIGRVSAQEIDQLGLTPATRLAMERALAPLSQPIGLIIDGSYNFLPDWPGSRAVTDADAFEPSVMAASIVAKVERDNYMNRLASTYPNYGFEQHVGYGTAAHRRALRQLGLTAEHRRTYKPIRSLTVV